MTDLYSKALEFATAAHQGQVRKYSGVPYITHPIAVADIVRTVPHTEQMLAAALLHDVVEDCGVKLEELSVQFGPVVSMYVCYLSDISTLEDGNRGDRKLIDAKHYAAGPAETQTIKVADFIHNTADIHKHDPRFWEVYKHEKWYALNLLTEADSALWSHAQKQIKELW